MPRFAVSPNEVLELVDLFHSITCRLINGACNEERDVRAQWAKVFDASLIDILVLNNESKKFIEFRSEMDRLAVLGVLKGLTLAATERGVDATRFYDVTGNIGGATTAKWDMVWSLVRMLHDRAITELQQVPGRQNQKSAKKRTLANVADVDAALQKLYEEERDGFLALTRDELAKLLQVSTGLISKTATWRKFRRTRSPKAIGLEIALDKDAIALDRLVEEQERDNRQIRIPKRV